MIRLSFSVSLIRSDLISRIVILSISSPGAIATVTDGVRTRPGTIALNSLVIRSNTGPHAMCTCWRKIRIVGYQGLSSRWVDLLASQAWWIAASTPVRPALRDERHPYSVPRRRECAERACSSLVIKPGRFVIVRQAGSSRRTGPDPGAIHPPRIRRPTALHVPSANRSGALDEFTAFSVREAVWGSSLTAQSSEKCDSCGGWPWEPAADCSAKIFNDSRRPTARLNQRPNCRTVSIQRSFFAQVGAKWAGIVPRLVPRISRPVQSTNERWASSPIGK